MIFKITLNGFGQNGTRLASENYLPSADHSVQSFPVSPRAMAEWEEAQGILITWTSVPNTPNLNDISDVYIEIVRHAQAEGMVYLITDIPDEVKYYLSKNKILLDRIRFLNIGFNSIWCRDYGPQSIYTEDVNYLCFVDWIYDEYRGTDDMISQALAKYLNIPVFEIIKPPLDLAFAGGNFMTDGQNTAFASRKVLWDNIRKSETEVDAIFWNYLGIQRFIKLKNLPEDPLQHIDTYIKLLNEETLLVGQYPPGVPNRREIESNIEYIQTNFKSCHGRPYKIVRIPMPPYRETGLFFGHNGEYPSYTNSMIINRTVLVPLFHPQYDSTALRIYHEQMPGYKIIGISSYHLIPTGGTLHCLIKEIGAHNPILIAHAPLTTQADTSNGYLIKACIKSKVGIDYAAVIWHPQSLSQPFQTELKYAGNDTFYAKIPRQPLGKAIKYYLKASDFMGKVITKPMTAPEGYWQFKVDFSTKTRQEIATQNGKFELRQNYPNPFNSITTIRYEIKQPCQVQMKIYNATGRQVRTLVERSHAPGIYSVKWAGEDDGGRPVSSGIYYYKLQTDQNESLRKRLLYLK